MPHNPLGLQRDIAAAFSTVYDYPWPLKAVTLTDIRFHVYLYSYLCGEPAFPVSSFLVCHQPQCASHLGTAYAWAGGVSFSPPSFGPRPPPLTAGSSDRLGRGQREIAGVGWHVIRSVVSVRRRLVVTVNHCDCWWLNYRPGEEG